MGVVYGQTMADACSSVVTTKDDVAAGKERFACFVESASIYSWRCFGCRSTYTIARKLNWSAKLGLTVLGETIYLWDEERPFVL